jgi:hypothetical protein
MLTQHLHLDVKAGHLSWRQIEWALLATLCFGGYVSAVILALT